MSLLSSNPTRNTAILGNNLQVLPLLPEAFARLIYIDPPFNTGKVQKRTRVKTVRDDDTGTRDGFGGKRYSTTVTPSPSYADNFGSDYVNWLLPRIEASLRCLTPDGSLFVHLDANEVHYVKVALDSLLGRDCFQNEIIWAYDYGGRSKRAWPRKHDTILWYARDPSNFVFNYKDMERIPYMAPGLVSKEKAAKGKTPTDVWWHTIVPTSGKEKTGYPTQKPLGILKRVIQVHSNPEDFVLDFFAGSGTTGEAAAMLNRRFVLIDESPQAIAICEKRLRAYDPKILAGINPQDLTPCSSDIRHGGSDSLP